MRVVMGDAQRGYLGSVVTPEPNGRVTVRLRLDELARFSPQAARWHTGNRRAGQAASDSLAA